MMRLLVPVVPNEQDWHALRGAAMLARRVGGHIETVLVTGDTEAAVSRYDSAPEGIRRQALEAQQKEWAQVIGSAEQEFDTLMRQQMIRITDQPEMAGTPTASWRVIEGTDTDAIQRWGAVHDLIVFSRAVGQDGPWREIAENALFGSGRPVLLVPLSEVRSLGDHVVIGWNRSPQAARAVADAMPVLRKATRVTVLSVSTGAKPGPSATDAARWLSWHAVPAQVIEVPPAQNGVGKLLLSEAHELAADLLVIGAYSHSRVRQAIFGGVTRHILTQSELPVFMAH